MDTKVFDADRFNKQTSYQDLLLEVAELKIALKTAMARIKKLEQELKNARDRKLQ